MLGLSVKPIYVAEFIRELALRLTIRNNSQELTRDTVHE
ncbi:hypothetical protein ALT1000_80093 [Alteromonas macleodii]